MKQLNCRFTWLLLTCFFLAASCTMTEKHQSVNKAFEPTATESVVKLKGATGLQATVISYLRFISGEAPDGFLELTGAPYTPSHNEDPAIPAQCWIETGYGTQNACKYCHTDYLAHIKHGNNFPIAEDQLRYSFPTPALNHITWRNITHPEKLADRLASQGIPLPRPDDPSLKDYVRTDNWRAAYRKARSDDNASWNNPAQRGEPYQLFPALNPDHLYPYQPVNPTGNNNHGYIDPQGFVRDQQNGYTGWRAVNFFPYAIFTPLSGSVSGIYLRLPVTFMNSGGRFDLATYQKNLELLELNIKNRLSAETNRYTGDAGSITIKPGFYPVGTEFAHPLHYVDLLADGDIGDAVDGVSGQQGNDYEFPGTRSKRVKEIRYLYKWKDIGLADISDEAMETESRYPWLIGREDQGWIDNKMGWILAAYIEGRNGDLRPQTTEELVQCLGCHSAVGNTIDSVWSFQRKLPGAEGWREMDYGAYTSHDRKSTRLADYYNFQVQMGEYEYFLYSVVGADLFGVMPREIKEVLIAHVEKQNLADMLQLKHAPEMIFDDHRLKDVGSTERRAILTERALIMRHYANQRAYLTAGNTNGNNYIKGTIFYPKSSTMMANIAAYRRIVLDQSFNLGKNTFGTQADAIPFTFRSDGTIRNGSGEIIPTGEVIDSRQWNNKGVGITPTGIARLNEEGEPLTVAGDEGDLDHPELIAGHVANGGTFDPQYNPILSDRQLHK